MIIKKTVPNPIYDKESCNDVNELAFEYIDDVERVLTYQCKDGFGRIHNCVHAETRKGSGYDIYVENYLYIMNNEGKTIKTIHPYREGGEKPQPKNCLKNERASDDADIHHTVADLG